MPTYTYLGLTDEQKKRRLEELTQPRLMWPMDKPGGNRMYTHDKNDGEGRRQLIKKNIEQWLKMAQKSAQKAVDEFDAGRVVGPYEFKKGESLEVDEALHPELVHKLETLCDSRQPAFARGASKPAPAEEPEEAAPAKENFGKRMASAKKAKKAGK